MRAFSNKIRLNIFYEKERFALLSVNTSGPFFSGVIKKTFLPSPLNHSKGVKSKAKYRDLSIHTGKFRRCIFVDIRFLSENFLLSRFYIFFAAARLLVKIPFSEQW